MLFFSTNLSGEQVVCIESGAFEKAESLSQYRTGSGLGF